jgi:hypothetical protein
VAREALDRRFQVGGVRVHVALRDVELGLGAMRPLGRFQAERDLKTFHRVFLRFANPAYTVSKTTEL